MMHSERRFTIQHFLVLFALFRNEYEYDAIFVQLIICSVKEQFGGHSNSRKPFARLLKYSRTDKNIQ